MNLSAKVSPHRGLGGTTRVILALCVIATATLVSVGVEGTANAAQTYTEYAGPGGANTWTNYTNAGGTEGPHISQGVPIQITCALTGFRVADGNTWWYQIGSSPWNNSYYVSADAFYNEPGVTSGTLKGTPFVDPAVPVCGGGGAKNETSGSTVNTWTNYQDAGGQQGPTIGDNATVSITCAVQGFRVADENTWWYEIASSPWNNTYYASADAFYNNGATSGSLLGTPFVDPAIPLCRGTSPAPPGGTNETNGSSAHTWSDYEDAGGTEGPTIPSNSTVTMACKITGFAVADGNTWWYQIASSPWSGAYYVSADAFYNESGVTSGSLKGTPFVDPSVPDCDSASTPRPSGETVGPGGANTWANYSHAGAAEGPTIPEYTTVSVACRVTGFRVADGNTWWYLVGSAPWNNVYYVSADAFYNNGATSGSLSGTPFVDTSVPICDGNTEAPIYSTAYGSGSASSQSTGCRHVDPVNCASGDFWQSYTDVSLSGRGPGLQLVRTYNDLAAGTQGIFGNGWSSTFDQHLTLGAKDGSILATLADGSQMIAEPNGSGAFTLPSYTDDILVQNGNGSYTLTLRATAIETFSATGQLTAISNLNGYATTFGYNSAGQLTTVTDTSGRTVTLTYGSNGLVASVVDPMGRTTTYSYSGSGDLTSVTDAMGLSTTFTYNSSDQMLTITDPRGGVTTNVYDSEGRVTSQTDPTGRTTLFSYTGDNFSSLGGTTTITDPNGNGEVEQYANGFLTEATKAYGTSDAATTTYTYDLSTFALLSETDPDGHTTTHTDDANGNLLSTTDPLGRTTTFTYSGLNEVLATTTPNGETTKKTYDASGNLLTVTDPMGNVTSYGYGDSSHPGDVTSVTDGAGETTTYTYDAYGNRTSQTVTPSPGVSNTTTYGYDLDGEQVCQSSPIATSGGITCPAAPTLPTAGATTTSYNSDGEVASVADPLGNTETYSYDADGNKITQVDGSGNTTSYTYDADNELIATHEPNGGSVSTTYDADGNKTATTDAKGKVTTMVYNALNQENSSTNPLGLTTAYTYDGDGNKLTMTDPSGRTTTYSYDADNELTGISYSDGTTPDVTYTYNTDGKRSSMVDGTGTTTYAYDADQRLASSTDGVGNTVSYSYDGDGHVTGITYPNGKTVTQTYDGAGELTSVADWVGNKTTFSYDHDGNELSANVLVTRKGFIYDETSDTYTYDADDDLLSTTDKSGTKTLQAFSYSRNADSLVTSQTTQGKSAVDYSYNAMSEVTAGPSASYTYDDAGNLTANGNTAPLTYNADELVSAGSGKKTTTYKYDAEGERTSTTPAKGNAITYSYDQAGRMTGSSLGSTTATYSYNGDGLRMAKKVNGGTASQFSWDTQTSTPLMLDDGSTSYIYGPTGLPLESVSNADSVVYYHHDQLGSTTLLTSPVGKTLATYSYGAYGVVLKHSGKTSTPLLFGGQYQDAESDLYYLQARYFDPTTGQFTSVDPQVATTGQPYEYAGDDPVNSLDPSGRFPWGDVVSAIIDHNPVVSLIQGGVTALGGYASATGTCFAYGWASNACSDATWNATIQALEFGINTLSAGAVGALVGVAEDYYNGHAWVPYSLSGGSSGGSSGGGGTTTRGGGSSSGGGSSVGSLSC